MTQAMRSMDNVALVPGRVLRVYGMRRSGNHALIDWIMRNTSGGGLFLNNCKPGRDPLQTTRAVTAYRDGTELDLSDRQAKIAAAGDAPTALVSYEDRMPQLERKPLYRAPETCVIIYRSFLHWAASLLRKIQRNPGYGPVERMRVMMNSIGTYGAMLDRVQDDDIVPLLFDRWTADDRYRADMASRLDLPGRDLGKGAVQRYGGGSSFQGQSATPDTLATDQRSAQMADDLEYQLILWTVARDPHFIARLAEVFPEDAQRLSDLLRTAKAEVTLP
ncbi:hypothetical protein GCM10007385_37580 [Tateyamaria omphalii]|uniref:hypothetical protein n=1 Tax=Tateyamaria omphalii TaxID=299262 RepID=UPI001677821C|nr:hypothetical protein [Tateyamaria omphalii]GGX64928.1 hypothetical protein GCM10007385_37580 [Tateyamaria omphalii]